MDMGLSLGRVLMRTMMKYNSLVYRSKVQFHLLINSVFFFFFNQVLRLLQAVENYHTFTRDIQLTDSSVHHALICYFVQFLLKKTRQNVLTS